MHSGRTRDNGHKLKQETFVQEIRKSFSTTGMVRLWKWLPREAVQSPALEVSKTRLEEGQSNLVRLQR